MAQNNKHKEEPVIDFDKMEVSNWKTGHLDADIYEDGTSSLPGIGKRPNEEEEVGEDFLKKFKETMDEFLRLAELGANVITIDKI